MTNFDAPGGFIKVIKRGKKTLVAVRLSTKTSFVLLHFSNFALSYPFY